MSLPERAETAYRLASMPGWGLDTVRQAGAQVGAGVGVKPGALWVMAESRRAADAARGGAAAATRMSAGWGPASNAMSKRPAPATGPARSARRLFLWSIRASVLSCPCVPIRANLE